MAPMAVFPSLTHLRLIALRSSLAIGVSSFSPLWAMLLPSPRKVPVAAPGDSIISFQVFWYYSSFLHRVLFWYKPCTGT